MNQKLIDVLTRTAKKHLGASPYQDREIEMTAEDIAMDAIVKLLEKGVTEEDDQFALGTKIVQDLVKDHSKVETRRREIEQENGEEINRGLDGSREYLSADPMEIMAYDEMRDRLDELGPKLYNTVQRHYIDGVSVQDIAQQEGASEDAIYKRLQRARDIVTGEQ